MSRLRARVFTLARARRNFVMAADAIMFTVVKCVGGFSEVDPRPFVFLLFLREKTKTLPLSPWRDGSEGPRVDGRLPRRHSSRRRFNVLFARMPRAARQSAAGLGCAI